MGRRYRFTFLAWGTQTDFVPETYILYLNKRESLQLSGGFLNGCFLIYTHNVHVNFRYFETMTALLSQTVPTFLTTGLCQCHKTHDRKL